MQNEGLTIEKLAYSLGQLLLQQQLRCAVAESCTGGALAAAITEIPGCSQWFERGFVTYSNEAKMELLDVSAAILSTYGAVSSETVDAMAQGVLKKSHANLSVAISGIAGPAGGTPDKPIGTVWLAWAGVTPWVETQCYVFEGDRHAVRQQAVYYALQGLIQRVVRAC